LGRIGEEVGHFLPQRIRSILERSPLSLESEVEEIRLRLERPLALHGRRGEFFLNERGKIVPAAEAYRPDGADLEKALQLLSSSSLYAFAEELRSGYITIPGGHRVGLCGQAVVEGGRVVRLKHINGLNYRIARQIKGVALPYVSFLLTTGAAAFTTASSWRRRAAAKPLSCATWRAALVTAWKGSVSPALKLPWLTSARRLPVPSRGFRSSMWGAHRCSRRLPQSGGHDDAASLHGPRGYRHRRDRRSCRYYRH